MGIFPTSLEIEEKQQTIDFKSSKEPLFDFRKKQIVTKDGRIVYCTYKQKIEQWVELIIRTTVDKYEVYKNTEFGFSKLYEYRGHQIFASNFGISELKREIKEKLEGHEEIILAKNIKISQEFNVLKIELTLELIEEELEKEVIIE
ncbi:MAG: DUF2634 domain-containing protein [Psychrilyobacter sp.]|uniref:DUF2634 domain-containing protein n=1 Tax=Psychrilyobacter sp. TaxID=2586924 RepID=UPI003C717B47